MEKYINASLEKLFEVWVQDINNEDKHLELQNEIISIIKTNDPMKTGRMIVRLTKSYNKNNPSEQEETNDV